MSPLESTLRLSGGVGGIRPIALAQARAIEDAIDPAAVEVSPREATPARPASSGNPRRPFLSPVSPEVIIRQAELLLQITAAAASSPALREIAAAAYRMEIDARREMVRARLEGMTAGRQWFA